MAPVFVAREVAILSERLQTALFQILVQDCCDLRNGEIVFLVQIALVFFFICNELCLSGNLAGFELLALTTDRADAVPHVLIV